MSSIYVKNENLFKWNIVAKPLYNSEYESIIKTVKSDDYFAFYKKRSNSNIVNEDDLICIHKNTYKVLDNLKLSKIAKRMSNLTGMRIHGVAEYNDGKYVMVFLENNLHINIAGFPMKMYLTILNSFNQDYSISFGTSTRYMRCQNTFSQISNNINISHVLNMDVNIQDLMNIFFKWKKNIKMFKKEFNLWSKTCFSEKLQVQAINYILGINYSVNYEGDIYYNKEISKLKLNKQKIIIDCVRMENEVLGETLWGFFNGITYYNTHINKDHIENFNLFGSSNKMNDLVYNLCFLNKNNLTNKLITPEEVYRYN